MAQTHKQTVNTLLVLSSSVILLIIGIFIIYNSKSAQNINSSLDSWQLVSSDCNKEACLFRNGNRLTGTATLRGYYKSEPTVYYEGGQQAPGSCDTLIVNRALSQDALPLIDKFTENNTEDALVTINTVPLTPEQKKSLLSSTKDRPAEVYVQYLPQPERGAAVCTSPVEILSVKVY